MSMLQRHAAGSLRQVSWDWRTIALGILVFVLSFPLWH